MLWLLNNIRKWEVDCDVTVKYPVLVFWCLKLMHLCYVCCRPLVVQIRHIAVLMITAVMSWDIAQRSMMESEWSSVFKKLWYISLLCCSWFTAFILFLKLTVMQEIEMWDFISLHNLFYSFLMIMPENHWSLKIIWICGRGVRAITFVIPSMRLQCVTVFEKIFAFGMERESEIWYVKSAI